nr:VOC family protein [Oharaeibacter diazotrophicus]
MVDDYDRALAFYRDGLGFAVVADTDLGGGKRWVLVAPRPDSETRLLLARAARPTAPSRCSATRTATPGTSSSPPPPEADTDLGGGKRWVLVAPRPDSETRLLLARAGDDAQRARIGDQTGGRVFLFLETDDFAADRARVAAAGATFLEDPRREAYGTVAVFRDPYGNTWDLIEPAAP